MSELMVMQAQAQLDAEAHEEARLEQLAIQLTVFVADSDFATIDEVCGGDYLTWLEQNDNETYAACIENPELLEEQALYIAVDYAGYILGVA